MELQTLGPLRAGFVIPQARWRENRLAVRRKLTGAFSSKRYRKDTGLVQVPPVTGWIWCGWNEPQNVGTWTKASPLSAELGVLGQELRRISEARLPA